MKRIEEHMAFYEAYHRHPLNKLTHFAGIPTIVFSVLVLLSAVSVRVGGAALTPAMLLVAAALAYYFLLQPAFGIGMALFLLPALALAHWVGRQSWGVVAAVFFALFIGGWILQLIGHAVFEKRRPALTDNLFQMVIGPIFLVAELFFLCGYRPGLHDRIRELSHRHDPA
jgi:uncharacterized membrane protein YGL010W